GFEHYEKMLLSNQHSKGFDGPPGDEAEIASAEQEPRCERSAGSGLRQYIKLLAKTGLATRPPDPISDGRSRSFRSVRIVRPFERSRQSVLRANTRILSQINSRYDYELQVETR